MVIETAAVDARSNEAVPEQPPKFARRVVVDDDTPVTVATFEHAIGMVLDRLDQMQADQADAMAKAMRAVLTDRETQRSVVNGVAEIAQEHATRAAGNGVWWLLRNVIARWIVIGALVIGAAKVLGWDVAARVGKWLAGATA